MIDMMMSARNRRKHHRSSWRCDPFDIPPRRRSATVGCMGRPRHPAKDIEAVLREAEGHGWRIEVGGKHFGKAKCRCGEHMRTIHRTPSDPTASTQMLMWFKRQSCWNGS